MRSILNNPQLYTQLERVSTWIVDLEYQDIPTDVIEMAKLQLLDAFAAIAAGSRSTMCFHLAISGRSRMLYITILQ
jgi:2-methylcitrate dehydratase PrpD